MLLNPDTSTPGEPGAAPADALLEQVFIDLTAIERKQVDDTREFITGQKKTFDRWIAGARTLRMLKLKSLCVNSKNAFLRLRTQYGLGRDVISDATVSLLLAILRREEEVRAWRAGLTEEERYEWASPWSIRRHCPALAPVKDKDDEEGDDDESDPKDEGDKDDNDSQDDHDSDGGDSEDDADEGNDEGNNDDDGEGN